MQTQQPLTDTGNNLAPGQLKQGTQRVCLTFELHVFSKSVDCLPEIRGIPAITCSYVIDWQAQ